MNNLRYKPDEVKIPPGVPTFDWDDYKSVENLGRGGVGEVYKVQKISTKEVFIIKKILTFSDEIDDKSHIDRIMHDMSLSTSLDHPNVMKCLGVCCNQCGIHFLYDFMACNMYNEKISDVKKLAEIAFQVLKGLRYLRKEKGFVFKHLSPGNILFDPESNLVKISDVGSVKDKYVTLGYVNARIGYMKYIAPENYHLENGECDLQGERYRKSDVWSLGLCLLQFYNNGTYPFPSSPFPDCLDKLKVCLLTAHDYEIGEWTQVECDVWPPKPPSDAPPSFRDFVSSCLKLDVSERADVDELLKHEFITTHCSVDGLDNAHPVVVSDEGDSSGDTEISDADIYEYDHLGLPLSSENDGIIGHQQKKLRLSAETSAGIVMVNDHRR